jgi:replication-associated recombination protein RarA
MRPRNLEEYSGQQHLLGPGKPLRVQIERDDPSSMILWGPPGSGKTTLAKIIAETTQASFIEFSAVMSGIKEIKQVMVAAAQAAEMHSRTILFVDEIHRFNKAQQDAFLPYVERGTIRLIGATTENPSFEIISALLSRCRVYVLHPLSEEHIAHLLRRALEDTERGLGSLNLTADDDALALIASYSSGDCRAAYNTLEVAAQLAQDSNSRSPYPKNLGVTGRHSKEGTVSGHDFSPFETPETQDGNESGHDFSPSETPEPQDGNESGHDMPGSNTTGLCRADAASLPETARLNERNESGHDMPGSNTTGLCRADASSIPETARLNERNESGHDFSRADRVQFDDRALAPEAQPQPRNRITKEIATEAVQQRVLMYDKNGEEHYNLISALHKSVRNSDPDAALYWLARMFAAGEDPLYLARRVVRMAVEDIGLAAPEALNLCLSAKEAIDFLGSPEGDLALAEAVVYLCLAPKSNSVYTAYSAVQAEIEQTRQEPVPLHLRNAPTRLMKELEYGKGYLYAHDEEGKVADMDCLPDSLRGRTYYKPTQEGREKLLAQRLDAIRNLRLRKHGGD